jgi:hypothetical protein
MADLFGFKGQDIQTPATADYATISFGGEVYGCMQVSVTYQQQINRRRTIGGKVTLLWASSPGGQCTIQRMITSGSNLKGGEGFSACKPASASLSMSSCNNGGGLTINMQGCVVSQYGASAEAEGLTCLENVVIDFVSAS